MINLLYGTSNNAKIQSMKDALRKINVSLLDNNNFDLSKIHIDENGNTPKGNAKIKALAFYDALQIPVFSCDTGLYFKNVEDKYQPGVTVRRVNDKYLSDEGMVEYYSNLAKIHGGEIIAYYKNAICLAADKEHVYSYDGEDICSEEFIISSTPHKSRTAGFPLDCLSIHIPTQKYYMDIKADSSVNYALKKDLSYGFCKFFIDNLKGVKFINR